MAEEPRDMDSMQYYFLEGGIIAYLYAMRNNSVERKN